jgi:uncharacterized protein YbaP (TraB family)
MAAMLFFHRNNHVLPPPARTRWQSGPFRLTRSIGTLSLLLILMLLVVPVSADDIYRWRDAAGVLHFADSPPASGKADRITSSTAANRVRIPTPQPAATLSDVPRGGVFWRIENDRSAPSFLLGTIHSADPRVLNWSAEIDRALMQADSFVMEMELNTDSFFKIGSAVMLTDGQDLADLLGTSDYRRLVAAMASQPVPEAIFRKMKPWVLLAFLSQPANGSGEFMDLRLYRQAMAQGKAVFGLETAEEQVAVFDGLPITDQAALLRSTLDHLADLPGMLDQMVDTYLTGDLAAIADLAQSLMKKDGSDLETRFLLRLNDERNIRMVARMMPRIEQGGAFIAVGALHLAGPTGIVRQLSARGYQLRPVD